MCTQMAQGLGHLFFHRFHRNAKPLCNLVVGKRFFAMECKDQTLVFRQGIDQFFQPGFEFLKFQCVCVEDMICKAGKAFFKPAAAFSSRRALKAWNRVAW